MSALLKLRITFTYNTQKRFQHILNQVNFQTSVPTNSNEVVPVFRNAVHFPDRHAIKDNIGNYTYGNLFLAAKKLASDISIATEGKQQERIVFLCPNDASYVITQWAIWISGQIAVPVHHSHPKPQIEYYCNNSLASVLITTSEYADLMQSINKNINKKLLVLDVKLKQNAIQYIPKRVEDLEGGLPNDFYANSDAMILYTSGTTGNPKGVVLSHKNLCAQTATLINAWQWQANDVILHSLPLHHTHGIVNALMCPLTVGAKCTMLPKFDANGIWSHLLAINTSTNDRITVFMAVPTMYAKLVEEYENIFMKNPKVVEYIKSNLKTKIRLMVSGSASLTPSLFFKWEEITGHKLLERYGMTEIGMCLSNEYNGSREAGYVGIPLPGFTVKLARKNPGGSYNIVLESNAEKTTLKPDMDRNDVSGELLVKGPSVFNEYFNNIEATKDSFTQDGFFKTGDTAKYDINKKMFKILGRTSVDIIKTGGFKVSALEIETHLLNLPEIEDCAVVGVEDSLWGQKVAALVVKKKNANLDFDQLKDWAKSKMAAYAVPTIIKFVDFIPKNTLGKVNKVQIVKEFFQNDDQK